MLILVIGINVGQGSLNFCCFFSVDIVEDVFESLRSLIEVFEHFVRFLDFTAVLSDSVDAIQILGRAEHCVARILIVFTCTDHLADEGIFENSIAERLIVDCLEHGILIGPGKLEHLQYVQP